jgi:hypothetical protein
LLPEERKALDDYSAKVAAVNDSIGNHSDDAIVARYRTPGTAPRPSKVEALEQAREHRRELKRQLPALRAEVAPCLTGILHRAQQSAEGVAGLIESSERDRAEAYAVPFTPSLTLGEIRGAIALLREFTAHVGRSPDLADVAGITRALGLREHPENA